MALALTIVLFLTIALVVFSFGAAAYAPSSVLGSRLRALGWQRAEDPEKPAFKERLEQALDPSQQSHALVAERSFARPALADPGRLPRTAAPDDVCRQPSGMPRCSDSCW